MSGAASADWRRAERALLAYRERIGGPAPFWLRDDDAVAPSPALDRLLAIAQAAQVPLSLAVIPALAEPALEEVLRSRPDVAVLQHGFAHRDHAPSGEKSREFGPDRPLDAMADEIARGRRRLDAFPGFVPIFVPPWNRIAPALAAALPRLGLPILSSYTNRREPEPIEGVVRLNTHLDPVDWHGGRGLGDTTELLARLSRRLEAQAEGRRPAQEPTGLLTHHLVHDADSFAFLAELLEFLVRSGLTKWFSGAMLLDTFGQGERRVAE